jgi:hypothetical protein
VSKHISKGKHLKKHKKCDSYRVLSGENSICKNDEIFFLLFFSIVGEIQRIAQANGGRGEFGMNEKHFLYFTTRVWKCVEANSKKEKKRKKNSVHFPSRTLLSSDKSAIVCA